MDDPTRNFGTVQVLLDRLNNHRLPRLVRLKDKVDNGAPLDDYDLRFLKNVLDDAEEARAVMADHEDLQDLVTRLVDLYHQVTAQALENEQATD